MTKNHIFVAVALLVGFVLGVFGTFSNVSSERSDDRLSNAIAYLANTIAVTQSNNNSEQLGRAVYDRSNLIGDVYNGQTETLMMQNGYFVGPINTANTAAFTADVAFDTNTLYVDVSTNRVGIGTTTPASQLDVYNTATSTVTVDGGSESCLALRDSAGVMQYYIADATTLALASTTAAHCGF